MKTLYSIILLMLISTLAYSQAPEIFNYQALIRDGNGNILANAPVSIQISFLQDSASGSAVYVETFNPTTTQYGLIALKLGKGSVQSGTFNDIDWGTHSYYIKIEVDPNNGTTYTSMGTSQLLSVPYALYAKSGGGDDADADPVNEIQTLSKSGNSISLSDGGGSVTDDVDDADADATNEFQSISLSGDELTLSDGGGTVILPATGSGDITAVNAGTGLDGGGTTGDVTLEIEVPLHLTSATDEVIKGSHSSGNYGYLGSDSYGVYGSSNGSGVFGYSSNWGVYGRNHNNNSGSLGGNEYAVYGGFQSNGNYGYIGSSNYGVYGSFGSSGNFGYLGSQDYGIYGEHGSSGSGVYGISNSGTGLSGHSLSGVGVYGETRSEYGVYGYHSNSGNNGYIGGNDNGVWGYSTRGVGVRGYRDNGNFGYLGGIDRGVYGENNNGNHGILASEDYGVYGNSSSGSGVHGETASGYGVYGYHSISGNNGSLAAATAGVYGSGSPYAGYFEGDVYISGDISKGGGSFKIDHPLDPANKFLKHSFVESPDMMNIYNGNVILDANGEAVVEMPEWFDALNKDFRYQLTCIGGYANVYIFKKINDNKFKIAGGSSGLEVSWQVTGVRKDAYANQNRIQIEELKERGETGKYLHPEAFGLPESMGIGYEESQNMKNLAGNLDD